MNFNKYNYTDDKVTLGSVSTSSSSSSSSTDSRGGGSSSSSFSLNRTIWGNADDGGDIADTMFVDGSIYLGGNIDYESQENDDDDEDVDNREFATKADDEGGNLYASGAVEGEQVYGKQGFINYPTKTDTKTDIATLLKKNSNDISTNASEIEDIKKRLELIEGADNSEIVKILDYGNSEHPVILFAGEIYRNGQYTTYLTRGWRRKSAFDMSASVNGGLLTITLTPWDENKEICVYSVHANQKGSGDVPDSIDNVSYRGRGDGAHWFACSYDQIYGTSRIYVREFHQGNGDNDTWVNDYWIGDGGINSINLTIIGFIRDKVS